MKGERHGPSDRQIPPARFMRRPCVVTDLEGVALLKDSSGELDKKTNPSLSHISDALGHYVAKEFPIIRQVGSVQDLIIG
jgi:hypothetical protein